MQILGIVLYILLLEGCADNRNSDAPPPSPPSNGNGGENTLRWELDFEDNFDGTSVSSTSWNMYNSAGHNNNGLRHPSAYSVENGELVVTAQMYEIDEANRRVSLNGQWVNINTNANLSSDGKSIMVSGGMEHRKQYAPGTKFEFRVRCEKDAANATSAVILTWPKSGSNRNTRCEESDIYETGSSRGSTRDRVSSFFHYGLHPDVNGGKVTQVQKDYDIDATEWHTMGFEWLPTVVYVYLDGEKVWTIEASEIVPIYDHHLCIQLDAFRTEMGNPVKMFVDWVKIHKAVYDE